MSFAQRRDLETLGKTTGDREIRLENVNRAVLDQLGEVEARELTLSRSDWQQARCAYLRKACDVVRHHWLLDESQFEFGRCGAESLGLGDVHRAVSVNHEIHFAAD